MDHPERESPLSATILADETERGGDRYSNLGKRLGRYAVAHERSLAMRDYIAGKIPQSYEQQKAAHELHHCGSYLVFRHYTESDRARLHGMRSCKQHTLCNLCAIRRGAKMLPRYLERFHIVMLEHPRLVAHMVTFTVKNGVDLDEREGHLRRSLKTFHKRRTFTDSHAKSEARKIKGAVWSTEIKRGTGSGLWHPHVHAVWLCDEGHGPDVEALAQEWKEITGDSDRVESHKLYGELADAFAEVFKYAVKFSDMSLADNWHAFQVLRRRRMVASSGLLWGVDVPEDLTDDPLDELTWVDLFYRFVRGSGYEFRGIAHTDQQDAA